MNVIVHYPVSSEGQAELSQRVACLHAQAVLQYVEKLPCLKEEKTACLNSALTAMRNAKSDT